MLSGIGKKTKISMVTVTQTQNLPQTQILTKKNISILQNSSAGHWPSSSPSSLQKLSVMAASTYTLGQSEMGERQTALPSQRGKSISAVLLVTLGPRY